MHRSRGAQGCGSPIELKQGATGSHWLKNRSVLAPGRWGNKTEVGSGFAKPIVNVLRETSRTSSVCPVTPREGHGSWNSRQWVQTQRRRLAGLTEQLDVGCWEGIGRMRRLSQVWSLEVSIKGSGVFRIPMTSLLVLGAEWALGARNKEAQAVFCSWLGLQFATGMSPNSLCMWLWL